MLFEKYVDATTDKVQSLACRPVWKNNSPTPAKMARNAVYAGFFLNEIPADLNFPDDAQTLQSMVPLYVGPQSEITGGRVQIETSIFAQPEVMAATHRFLIVWGWVEYNDVIEGTPRHRSEFSAEVEIMGDPTDKETLIRWQFYRLHNGADEDALKRPCTNKRGELIQTS